MSADPKALYEELLAAHHAEGPGLDALRRYVSSDACTDPDIILNATADDLEAAAQYGEFTVLAARARGDALRAVMSITGAFAGTLGDWYASASDEDRAAVVVNLALLVGGDAE